MQTFGKFFVCGIGRSTDSHVQKIKTASLIISRGMFAERWLEENGISSDVNLVGYNADNLKAYEARIAATISQGLDVSYITPVSPFHLDQYLQQLTVHVSPNNFESLCGINVSDYIPRHAYKAGILVSLDAVQAFQSHHPSFSSDENVLLYEPSEVPHLHGLLARIYSSDTRIFHFGMKNNAPEEWVEASLAELVGSGNYIAALFIPAQTQYASLESFEETISHLRSPQDGCPWDQKQTHASLRTYLLEETYEALDALDRSDIPALQEELGDLLLQILLHAEIAFESEEFSMQDVISGINEKLIYRHPHVFKDWKVKGADEVVQNWEALKEQERNSQNGDEKTGVLDGVPLSFPALAQAQAIQGRAARVGFDWPAIEPVLEKVVEELQEIKAASNENERASELGDLLFSIVNVIRWLDVDAESALRQTNQKFRSRFKYLEEKALLSRRNLRDMTLEEMDSLWEEAKRIAP